MKKSIYSLTILVLASTFAVQAAAEVKRTKAAPSENVTDGLANRLGLGLTTFNSNGGSGSLSAIADLNSKINIQPFVSIIMSDPFNFTFGSILRYTMTGNEVQGLHIGLGFDLGTTGATKAFYLNIFPVIGIHLAATDRVALSFDVGANFHVTPSPFQFSLQNLGGANALAGASIHYFL